MENCNFKTEYYSRVKTFWPVQNNQIVIDSVSNINSRNNAILVSTFLFLNCIYKYVTPEIERSDRRVY